jgi:hypothetical protein
VNVIDLEEMLRQFPGHYEAVPYDYDGEIGIYRDGEGYDLCVATIDPSGAGSLTLHYGCEARKCLKAMPNIDTPSYARINECGDHSPKRYGR